MTNSVSVEVDRVGFNRQRHAVLDGINAAFHEQEWTAIVGPNGSGKSTLMALMAGLLTASTGSVRLAGRNILEWGLKERARRLTWLGQTTSTEGDIAAREVVHLGRIPIHGWLGARSVADDDAVAAALQETDATPFADRRIGQLSGGERQRILLARAFVTQTSVLLLDEPTVHLDAPHQRRLIRSLLTRARGGGTVVTVLHDLTLALAADRLIVLCDGRVRALGSPNQPHVRATLTAVFGDAVTIERLGDETRPRWTAVPALW